MAASSVAIVDTAVPLQLCCITIIINGHVHLVAGLKDLGRLRDQLGPRSEFSCSSRRRLSAGQWF
jgi:hypothetical protein